MEIGKFKRFYLITDGGRLRSRGTLCSCVELALKMGRGTIGWVQLREQLPSSDVSGAFVATDAEVLDLARRLAPICHNYCAKLLINRRPDLAKDVPGVGVHLSRLGTYIETARDILGYDRLIGYSAHSVREALEASARGVDYVSISPVYAYAPKDAVDRKISHPSLGLAPITELVTASKTPVFAVGGINIENVADCFKAGATGVGVLSSILLSDDVGRSAGAFAQVVEEFFKERSADFTPPVSAL